MNVMLCLVWHDWFQFG